MENDHRIAAARLWPAWPARAGSLVQAWCCVLLWLISSISPTPAQNLFEPIDTAQTPGAIVAPVTPTEVGERVRLARLSMDAAALADRRADPSTLRAAAAGDFQLNLFPDRSLPVRIAKVAHAVGGRSVLFGKVIGSPESSVILAFHQGVMAGSVFLPGQKPARIEHAGDDMYRIVEFDPRSVPPCGAKRMPGLRAAAVAGELPAMSGDERVNVDLLVVYTRAARVAAGSVGAIEATIAAAVAEANQAFENSGVAIDLELVRTEETTYSETGNPETDLGRLQGRTEGFMDAIHNVRAAYGADLVLLLTETMQNFAGLAYLMSNPSPNAANSAFAVVKREFATGTQTFAHEVAHLFGCQHDRANADGNGAFDYSYGHRFDVDAVSYRTVMAYAPGERIPYFSNPEVSFMGVPTGVASGQANAADNALTLRNTAAVVAAFSAEATSIAFEMAETNIVEAGFTLTAKVIRRGDTTGSSTVRYATAGVTAGSSDYVAAVGGLRFEAGETLKTIALPVMDDQAIEGEETMRLVLSHPTNAVLGAQRELTVRIADDDTGFTFQSATASVAENATNILIEIRRTGNTSRTNTVSVATAGLGAAAGLDFEGTNATVVFPPGMTNATLTLGIVNDAELETNETFRVFLSNPTGGAGLVKPTNLVATILEDDSGLALATNSMNVLENAGVVMIKVVRSGGINFTSVCHFLTSDGTASKGADYSGTEGVLTFDPGVRMLTIPIPISNNSDANGDRTFHVALTNAEGAILTSPAETLVSIKDTDATFSFESATATIGEGDVALTLAIIRSGGVAGVGSVEYATGPGTAQTGKDFVPKTGVLYFKAGELRRTITIPVINDLEIESTEQFSVTLSEPDAEAALGATAACTVSVIDNDCLISFATNQITALETAGQAVLSLTRTGSLGLTNALSYRVVPISAILSDFVGGIGRVTFLPGQTNADLAIPIVNDELVEGAERFAVVISSPTAGAVIQGTNTAYVAIADDEVGLAFETKIIAVAEDGTNLVVNVVQTGDTNQFVSVEYRTRADSAADGLDFTATNGFLHFGPGTNTLTVTVPILDDILFETNETFRISLTNAIGAILLANSNVVAKILENDAGFAFRTNSLTASEHAPFVTVTVVRTGGTNFHGSLDYFTTDGTATNGLDYVSTNGTLEFIPGVAARSFAVPLLNDTVADGAKTIFVTLTNAVGAALSEVQTGTITVRDNDSIFEFVTDTLRVWEGVGSAGLTIVRHGGTAGVATVRVGSTNGTAIAPLDFAPQNGQLTFADGETAKTIKLVIVNDTGIENDEDFRVLLHTPGGEAALGTNRLALVTIADNDCLLSIATNRVTASEEDGQVTLNFHRTGTLAGTNVLAFRVAAGTATALDYKSTNQLIVFPPGATNATLVLGLVDDVIVENAETFTVQISSASDGGRIDGTNTVAVTIVDNETGLGFGAARYAVHENGANVAVTIVQLGNTNLSATVNFATIDLGAKNGFDYGATNGTLQFGPGTNRLTIEIPILDDTDLETNEMFAVSLGNAVGGSVLTNSTTVLILEDDTAIALSTNRIDSLEVTPFVTLTLVRTGGTNLPVSAELIFADESTTSGEDYTLPTNRVITFPAGITRRSLTVPIQNDRLVEGNELFQAVLTNLVGAGPGLHANTAVTILDNDSLVEFESVEESVGEAAGVTTVNVRRTGGLAVAATIRFATSNLTATAASDYLAKTGVLTFRPGETNKTITLQILNDSILDPGESFQVWLTAAIGETALGTNAAATLSIEDNDVTAGDVVLDQVEPMRIRSLDRTADGCTMLHVSAPRGAALLVERSSNLEEWTFVVGGRIGTGAFVWDDCPEEEASRQFYRVRQPAVEIDEE